LKQKKTTTYDIGNPSPGLGQEQKCGRVKPVNETPTLSSCLFDILSMTWCFLALMSKRKDWLAHNQDNVPEWSNMSIHRLLFQ
jgi:hypothetical protein